MGKPDHLRKEAAQVRLNASCANDHWKADWLEKLALLEDMIEDNCEDAKKLLEASKDPTDDDLIDDNEIEYRRLVNTRDKLETKGWLE